MSIFITLLAFNDPETIAGSKLAILLASTCATLLGMLAFVLIRTSHKGTKG
jgi:Na+/H+ antiporter NhaA